MCLITKLFYLLKVYLLLITFIIVSGWKLYLKLLTCLLMLCYNCYYYYSCIDDILLCIHNCVSCYYDYISLV